MKNYCARARALVARTPPEEKTSRMIFAAEAVERPGVPAYRGWNEALTGVKSLKVSVGL